MKLADYLASLGPFDWQASNCCHFAAGWLVANGQPDPMEGLRATPTILAARRLERELGGRFKAINRALGRIPVGAVFAQLGDIVLFNLEHGFTLGICNGRTSVCRDANDAFVWVPTLEGTCAWRLKP